jgi:signal transduction histidine kinase
VKYSDEGTNIEVRVTRSASEAFVEVIDRGAGIPQEDIPHLFSRFYRVAATAEQAQGAGLGLYIANRLVRAHGGSIKVESEVDHGSTFIVSLPLHGVPTGAGNTPTSAYTTVGSP